MASSGPPRAAPAPVSPALAGRVERLARGADPADPAAWAVRHGLAPLLHWLGVGPAWDPPERIELQSEQAALLWEVTLHHLRTCAAALSRADVPCLVLKGALHALRHYPEPSLRAMADLDLLVPGERWRDAARVVTALGFDSFDRVEHAGAFAGPAGRVLELHSFLTSCPRLFPVTFRELHDRSVSLRPAAEAMGLGDEDALVHAGLHIGFQHGFRARLGQYLDVERMVSRALDWDRALALARRARALRPLAGTLAVLEALLDVRAPEPAREVLRRETPSVVRRWIGRHRQEPWRLLGGLPLARARWTLVENAACRVRLLAFTLFPMQPDGRRSLRAGAALRRAASLVRASLRRPRADGS